MTGYYDKAGKPITVDEYISLTSEDTYFRIGLDEFDGVRVSTVWMGIDHNLHDGKPVIFETMVFGGNYDGDLRRYSSEGQSLIGHRCAVNNLRRGRAPW